MKTNFKLLLLAGIFAGFQLQAAPTIEEGKTLFTTRCAACHNVNKALTGPALAGVDKKQSIEWIISFVRSSQTLIKSGDKDAIATFEKFNKFPMPDHPDLSDDQIKSILAYIVSESKTGNASAAPFAIPGKKKLNYKPYTTKDYEFFIGYLAVISMLIMAMIFAVQAKTFQREMRGKKLSS